MASKGKGFRLGVLGIGQKIWLGYGVTLGIAIGGVLLGMGIGAHTQQRAFAVANWAQTKAELLNRLRTSVLETRLHEYLLFSALDNPESLRQESAVFAEYSRETQLAWWDLQVFLAESGPEATGEATAALFSGDATDPEHSHGSEAEPHGHGDHGHEDHRHGGNPEVSLPQVIEAFDASLTDYLQQVEALDRQLSNPAGQGTVSQEAAEIALLALINSEAAADLDDLSHELEDLTAAAYNRLQQTQATLDQAIVLNRWIVLGSVTLSIGLALVLGRYLSHSLSQPLRQVTAIAQRITREDNFALQAPVTSRDEIGTLAAALNGLAQRVQTLLTEQEAVAQQKLIQSEKMAGLGQMLAGVAHEINNPVNFIHGNLIHAQNYVTDLLSLIHAYEAALPEIPDSVQVVAEDIDQEFLEEDLPQLLKSMQIGSERTCQIVMSLKNFSRLDNDTSHSVDLHACLDTTLLLLHNRLKKGVEVVLQYGDIPLIEGSPGSLYQVFMNLLSNALDAFQDEPPNSPILTITTERSGPDHVAIHIADNGPGIPTEHQAKIFEAFFTTKPTGVGTGLGLSISREVVVEKHHGQISCQSSPGAGTTFTVELPIVQPVETGEVLPPQQAMGDAVTLAARS
ncbi:sensor histidine kinase [Leptolyngbya sp. PCC 6406]|uniref:sensor histidine kinase n=1 Tax=Leptolyngbya sp. PCC 6406 TaxID=1173264 RepID=UPI0002ABC1FB|nr:ATP-binding protein [Leptolyngbya sp. PCC 6406]